MPSRCGLCGEFNPTPRHAASCRGLRGKQAPPDGLSAPASPPHTSTSSEASTALTAAPYGAAYRQYQEAVEVMEDEGGPIREPVIKQAPSDPPPSLEQTRELIRTVILETYSPDVAERLAEKTCDEDRLRKNLAERAWFTHYGDDWELIGLGAVHMQDEETAAITTHFVSRRGEGIGSALTERRLDWAREMGAKRVLAHTHPWNLASLGNLQKHGFQIVDETVDGWSGNGGTIYELELVL